VSTDKRAKRLAAFRGVAEDRIVRMNLAWIQFEQGQADELAALLREAHTLKGEASLMGFGAAGELLHAVEDALEPVAKEAAAPTEELGDLLLEALDLVLVLVGDEPAASSPDADALAAQLRGLGSPHGAPSGAASGAAAPAAPTKTSPAPGELEGPGPADRVQTGKQKVVTTTGQKDREKKPSGRQVAAEQIRVTSDKLDRMRDAVGELLLARIRLSSSATELRKARELLEDYQRNLDPTNVEASRLSTTMIELLSGIEVRLAQDDFNLDRLITELEATSRELRMVPLGTLFEKYPRAVRQLGRDLGKKVKLEMDGQNLDVDRAVLTRLEEPLIHLVRNAIDHGLESPKERLAAGKPETGVLRLAADVQGRSLAITVADDGAGIDPAGVRRRAVELGIVNQDEAEVMPEEELLRLLFASGMSTRRQVTTVSGRGIGLDVVQTQLEAVGGQVSVKTSRGSGTQFILTVPITVAISSVLLMRIGTGRYALAAHTVVTVVDAADYPSVDTLHGPAVRFDGALIPLLSLDQLLGEASAEVATGGKTRLVILRSAGGKVALSGTYDHIEREAVMKSAGPILERDPVVRAVVPLEDGSLALVLKASELLTAALRGGAIDVGPTAQQVKTVVVADDSPVIRDLVAEALRSHGLRVIEAADGMEALQRVDENPEVDLVVTDVEMPRLDGIGLITGLRKRPGRRIPAVVVSMRGSDSDKAKAIAAGADAYLVKTDFSHQGLWAMIARFLE